MTDEGSATGVLRDEHQRILMVMRVLGRLLDAGERQGAWDLDAIGDCVMFFRLFADACHHGKEEDLLFPELEARGIPREGGPIGVMLYEHQMGRGFVRAMRDNLGPARGGDMGALTRLAEAGRQFIDLLTQHIHKEDHILFNMADHVIDGTACMGLCRKYDEVCGREFEGNTKAALEEIAARLRAKCPD
ncbi:MAG: hemerythrin domain-containing protein [Verrucomicrobiae bacterium]|nr:hemerythrin domain-containing protein [Verrucomicrobiae bacterium]